MNAGTLGIDIGGVIISRIDNKRDTSFKNNYLETPEIPGAAKVIKLLSETLFGKKIYLVSKCGSAVQKLTRDWLGERNFFERSSIPPGNAYFCERREEKAGICEALGVTHFIDDRLEVLGYLKNVENLYLFQPRPDEVRRFARHLERVRLVHSWNELRAELVAVD